MENENIRRKNSKECASIKIVVQSEKIDNEETDDEETDDEETDDEETDDEETDNVEKASKIFEGMIKRRLVY
jgi:hypothetical protein